MHRNALNTAWSDHVIVAIIRDAVVPFFNFNFLLAISRVSDILMLLFNFAHFLASPSLPSVFNVLIHRQRAPSASLISAQIAALLFLSLLLTILRVDLGAPVERIKHGRPEPGN